MDEKQWMCFCLDETQSRKLLFNVLKWKHFHLGSRKSHLLFCVPPQSWLTQPPPPPPLTPSTNHQSLLWKSHVRDVTDIIRRGRKFFLWAWKLNFDKRAIAFSNNDLNFTCTEMGPNVGTHIFSWNLYIWYYHRRTIWKPNARQCCLIFHYTATINHYTTHFCITITFQAH